MCVFMSKQYVLKWDDWQDLAIKWREAWNNTTSSVWLIKIGVTTYEPRNGE